jgi:hypothetical protein
MGSTSRTRVLLLVAALSGSSLKASAQELVTNGHFHGDIAGWTLIGVGTQAWDPVDWQANPGSGSIRIVNMRQAANQFAGSGQCIPLTPSGTYELGTHVRFPSGQVDTGFGSAAVAWFDNTNCAPPALSVANSPLIPSAATDTWIESFMAGLIAPPGTVAAGVGPGTIKTQASGSLAVLFDRVRFGPSGTTPVEGNAFTVE